MKTDRVIFADEIKNDVKAILTIATDLQSKLGGIDDGRLHAIILLAEDIESSMEELEDPEQ